MDLTSPILIIIILVCGILLGVLAAWFLSRRKSTDPTTHPEFQRIINEKNGLEQKLEDYRKKEVEWSSERAIITQKNEILSESLDHRKEELEKTRLELKKEFENLAHKIFDQKSHSFRENSELSLKRLLEPFDKNIQSFKKDVVETYEKSWKEREQLSNQLKELKELNQTMSKEAHELTQALKGENKTQGNWGELILERILENSGLEKGREYELQYATHIDDGKRVQPDVVVHLPEDKHIIIDSKVSLKAYEQYFNAEEEAGKAVFLKGHVESLRNHIKLLHSKSYTEAKDLDTPDFVLLFLPIEASFGMAIDADKDLFDFAWSRNIVIVTPSTLLATLRTIASIWKHEKTNRNAAEIAEKAGKLYDKFVLVLEGMLRTQKQFNTAQKSLDETVSRLGDGRGSVLSRVEDLRKMGASTTKSLKEASPELYSNSMGEEENEENEG